MAKLNLAKEQNTVLNLAKAKNAGNDIKMQVKLLQDVSGSMSDEFRNGLMETVLQRVIAFASVIDPDHKVETIAYSSRSHHMGELDITAFDNATQVFLEKAKPVLWGGTNYASVFEALNNADGKELLVEAKAESTGLFGKIKSMFTSNPTPALVAPATATAEEYPNMVIFITDGEDGGSRSAFMNQLATTIADGNTFVLLLGAGNEPTDFSLLQDADKKFEGVDFVSANGIRDLDNDTFYEKLMTPELMRFITRWNEKAGK